MHASKDEFGEIEDLEVRRKVVSDDKKVESEGVQSLIPYRSFS